MLPAESISAGMPDADCLFSAVEVAAGFDSLASQIQPLVSATDCVLLGVMTGGLYPLVRLSEKLAGDFLVDFCHVTRYRGEQTGGELEWLREPNAAIAGRTVVIVDDIWDEGVTLTSVASVCRKLGASDVRTAVLVVKDRERRGDIGLPDFDAGLHVPDVYVFGCGMDVQGRWRHLPAIYALRDAESR